MAIILIWYGLFYYVLLILLINSFFFVYRFISIHILFKKLTSFLILETLIGIFIFSILILFFFNYFYINLINYSYYALDNNIRIVSNLINSHDSFLFLNYNGMGIFYFPYIYIFMLITGLSLIFCLSYNINELASFFFYSLVILISGSVLFFSDSLVFFFFSYEMLLIPSFFILYKFAKTRRSVEAAYLMFFWTQFGALWLIFSFIYVFFITNSLSFYQIGLIEFSKFEINFCCWCWIIGFGVKLPIWPFYNWLPKAHVEASTNFSIFLSGVLVKFAFFGLFKCLLMIKLEPTFFYILPFILIGLVDSSFKLFYQIDLKKLVAYSTVIEMHWLTICILSGQSPLILSAFCMLISHALLSTNSFLLVDAISRRFKTRLITEIGGLNILCPKLFLIILANCLIFLGFPGSIFFIAEFLFFTFSFDTLPVLSFFLLILLYFLTPTFFFKNWMNLLFGFSIYQYKLIPLDLNSKEFVLFLFPLFVMFWLGFSWQYFIF